MRACIEVALNIPVMSWAPRVWTWVSYVTKALRCFFLQLGVYQTNTPYIICKIITILNICLIAKKLLPHMDLAIFDNALIVLTAFLLTFDTCFFQLNFDYKVIPRFLVVVVLWTICPPLSFGRLRSLCLTFYLYR